MFLARLPTILQRKNDLTNELKVFFRGDSFKLCSKLAEFLGEQGFGFLGGARAHVRARTPARERSWGQQGLKLAAHLKRAIDKVQ